MKSIVCCGALFWRMGRPPSRGAWIEIGVEKKKGAEELSRPPSRGAWIEIHETIMYHVQVGVAPPRGGRGLK